MMGYGMSGLMTEIKITKGMCICFDHHMDIDKDGILRCTGTEMSSKID